MPMSLTPLTYPINKTNYLHLTPSQSLASGLSKLATTKVFILTLMLPCTLEKCADTEAVPPCFLDEDDDEVNEFGQREMTKEEEEIYYRAVSESQGFDVPVFPNTMAIGRIEPITTLREYFAEEIEMTANLSIEDYNKKNESNYEVVEIIKANYMGVAGFIFYVTYSVKPANQPANFPTTIFQAKVFFKIDPDDIEILICRPKPNEGEKPAEDQVGMRCCC